MKNPVQKKVALFLAIAVLSLMALSACNSASTVPADTTATVPGTASDTAKVNGSSITGSVELAPGTETGTQVVSDDVKNLLANQDKLNVIVAKGDVAGCKELDMPQFQVSCETNILANKAASNKDLAVCDSALTADVKARCQEVVSNKVF